MTNNESITENKSYREPQDRMQFLPNYYRWIYTYAKPFIKGTVMDLGCGRGLFIAQYFRQAKQIVAVDHDEKLLQQLRQNYLRPNLLTVRLDLNQDWHELDQIKVDTLIALDLLEHFKDDQLLVKKMCNVIKPGGHIFVKVPAQRALYSKMDQASGHYRRYDANDLYRLAFDQDLEILATRHINPLGAWVYQYRNQQPTNFSMTFTRLQLRLINLCLYGLPLLDRVPKLKGLSFIGVFRMSVE